ncbi:hypothetical protein VCHA53O466_140077 [Vibrio chagasii]|nr:hypothetical protein VCHA53O466_140077 [Vibrio chagasii]
MHKHDIRSKEDAARYLLSCTLATVDRVSTTKSRRKGELVSALTASQKFFNTMLFLGLVPSDSRSERIIISHENNVASYSTELEKKYNVKPFKGIQIDVNEPPYRTIEELLQAHYDHAKNSAYSAHTNSEVRRQLSISDTAKEWL